jgi:hypothetical protein
MTISDDPAAPDKPARPTLAALAERIDAEHELHHELIRKADQMLTAQAELMDMIRPYVPLLERIAHLAGGPAGKIIDSGPLAALMARRGKRGTPPDG